MFGVSGKIAYKNRKRNKKKYRVVVISIMVSVTIFIAMFSFTQLMGDMVSVEHVEFGYSLSVDLDERITEEDLKNFADVLEREDVKEVTISRKAYLEFNKKHVIPHTKQAETIMRDMYDGAGYTEKEMDDMLKEVSLQLVVMPNEKFKDYAKSAGAKNVTDTKQAILVNDGKTYVEDKMVVYQIYDCKPGTSLEGYYYKVDGESEKAETCSASVTIGAVTDVHPVGYEATYFEGGLLVVSDAWVEQYPDMNVYGPEAYIDCEDADALQKDLMTQYGYDQFRNIEEERRAEQTMLWIMNIFMKKRTAVNSN